jgi:signal transduction histidine kinase
VLIATTNLRSQIEKEGAAVTTTELPKLIANPGHLIQIFQNLIGNGLKYRGEDPPRIAVSATKGDEEWIFSVTDNGIGIAPDYHEKIFIPFKRLHGQQYPGSGVGLAICRRIVERHGGRIWVESEPGRGATFYFSVPTTTSAESIEQRSSVAV